MASIIAFFAVGQGIRYGSLAGGALGVASQVPKMWEEYNSPRDWDRKVVRIGVRAGGYGAGGFITGGVLGGVGGFGFVWILTKLPK